MTSKLATLQKSAKISQPSSQQELKDSSVQDRKQTSPVQEDGPRVMRKRGSSEKIDELPQSRLEYSFNNGYHRRGSDRNLPKARRTQTEVGVEPQQFAKTQSSMLKYET